MRWFPITALALLMTLTGCADTSEAPEARSTTSPTPAVSASDAQEASPAVAAYRAWLDGLTAEDAEAACDQHAPDFTIALRQRAILVDRAEQGDPCEGFVALLWESPTLETEPVAIEVTQQTEEDALLAVDFDGTDQTVRMVHRSGSWYLAATTPREAGSTQWLTAWCTLEVGMDRDAVVAAMGEPSGEYTVANGGEPQLWWASGPYDFRAYLNPQGLVTELVADHDALTAQDRATLDCPELRNRTNS